MDSLKEILQDSGAQILDQSGRQIPFSHIKQKVDTTNQVSSVQQELSELSDCEKIEWLSYHKLIGNKYYRCGNYVKASEIYLESLTASKLLKDDNTTVILLCNLASCLIKQSEAHSAIKILKQALEIQPNHARALERRAAAYNMIGKIEEAEKDLRNGIKVVKEKALEERLREMLKEVTEDKAKKKKVYEKMIEKNEKIVVPKWVSHLVGALLWPLDWVKKVKTCCKRKKTHQN